MLRIFIRLLLVIGGAALLLAVVGWALPREFSVSVERQLAATPAEAFAIVNDLRSWPQWTAWDPQTNVHLTVEPGPISVGEGASQTWTDPRGAGKLWFTAVQPDEAIGYRVRFVGFPEMDCRFEFSRADSGCRVQWTSSGRLPGGPFYGYLRGAFRAGLEREYTDSLKRLDQLLTKNRTAREEPSTEPGTPSEK